MLIKTSELTGTGLDWAVAKADNNLAPVGDVRVLDGRVFYIEPGNHEITDRWIGYSPSTDWSQGGQIIEWEGIQLHVSEDRTEWLGSCWGYPSQQYGSTPLVAAMRCFVASKLGDEVEVPDGLL